jgi:hypothetical protein
VDFTSFMVRTLTQFQGLRPSFLSRILYANFLESSRSSNFFTGVYRFYSKKSRYHRHLIKRKELLFKAFGSGTQKILDLTGGLGEDAWILARLGVTK